MLLGSTKRKISKNENSNNKRNLEIGEVVLVHCNIVNNDFHQVSKVLYAFVVNKLFGLLLDISIANCLF